MEICYEEIKKQIQEKYFAEVQTSLSKKELDSAAETYLQFLELSIEEKSKFAAIKLQPQNRSSHIGYRQKKTAKSYPTKTEYFHYNDYIENYFYDKCVELHPTTKQFLENARKIYDEGKYILQRIVLEFEKHYPGIHERFFPNHTKPIFYLRFLKYYADNNETHLAKGHFDRGACTLAIAESNPGLRLGTNQENLKPIEHKEGTAIFMPGLQFPAITSNAIKPVWHDVVQKGEYKQGVARWAIVLFADYVGMRNVRFQEAH